MGRHLADVVHHHSPNPEPQAPVRIQCLRERGDPHQERRSSQPVGERGASAGFRRLEVKLIVLIVGEPGTGKRTVARTIHHLGAYRNQPLVPLDDSLRLSFVDLGKAVMLIQFFRRDVPRTEQIRQRVHEIRAVIPGETPPLALWWRHRVSLAFYLVPATPEQAVILRGRVQRLLGSPWGRFCEPPVATPGVPGSSAMRS